MKSSIRRAIVASVFALLLVLFEGFPCFASGGTVITSNLPANTAIINIDATADGAAAYNGDQTLWKQPFNSSGILLQYTVAPGTYTFRVIDPADAAEVFPALTSAQTNEIYTGWTYNSPWLESYLVFDSAATNDPSQYQIIAGADSLTGYSNATNAYQAALTNGFYDVIRTGPQGRKAPVQFGYVFTNAETLVFTVPDWGLYDNAGGVSVLISPVFFGTDNLLLNPGAETGSLTNWTAGGDSNPFAGDPANSLGDGFSTHSGNYYFVGGHGSIGSLAQVVTLVGNQGLTDGVIDSGRLTAEVSFWEQGLNQGTPSDSAYVTLDFWDSASNLISTVSTPEIDSHDGSWSNYVANFAIPAGTRFIRYTMNFVLHAGSDLDAFVDDNSLSVANLPAPALDAKPSGNGTLTLQWPTNAWGFVVTQTTNLASGVWNEVTNVPSVMNTNYSIAVPMDATNRFFRLHFP